MSFDRLLHVFGTDKNTVISFIYLPPENSPFYEGKELVGIGMLDNLLSKFSSLNDVNIVVLGDLNARTSERNDYINDAKIVPALEEYEVFLTDDILNRTSCDKHVNKFGIELLGLGKAYMIRIL